jgi:hypothetical protein
MPYVKMELHSPNYPEPPPEIIKGDPEFEVEQIVGSRQIGKKKTLQYKVHWKGYSATHDSWEPAKQVHTPDLIKQFQKTKSSRKNNATINYQSASGILPRPSPLKQPRTSSSLPEAESLLTAPETDRGSGFGKRTQESLIIQMASIDWRSSSNSDKRRGQVPENTIIIPPFFHINSCTITNNKQIFNPKNNDPPPLSRQALNQLNTSHIDPSAPGSNDALTLLLEGEAYAQQEANERDPNQDPLSMSTPIRLKMVEEILAGPSNPPILAATSEGEGLWRILQEGSSHRSNQTLPTNTEDLHPGYPYRENINNNDDLPQDHYPHPYLAAQVNRSNGDPRILGRAEKGAATYDEGPLTA